MHNVAVTVLASVIWNWYLLLSVLFCYKRKGVATRDNYRVIIYLNIELKLITDWMKTNRLALSIHKTNFILFHSNKLKPYKSINLKIDNKNIQQVNSVKYLGVLFDSNLTWKPHISELCKKISKTIGILSKIRYFVTLNILIMLYYSLIYSFFIYGVQVWGLTYPSYLKPISILQKKLVRVITFSHPRSHSEPIFKYLNLLKFTDVINLQILTFVYQWFHELTPDNFSDYFELVSDKHFFQTRQAQNANLYIKSVNTTQYGLRSIQYIGI